ncbi:MAG: exodeoxyribonuclease VII small subunit [Saprospiraceae bacterium]|nr:exodeoxyribonuclease VII small subunit [Saprospiraceae bacterium]
MKQPQSDLTYALAMQRLQEIASDLESGSISIDELESVIAESKELVTFCEIKLRTLETRIEGLEQE